MTDMARFIRRMPKVELYVRLEGAVRPATLLRLADRHNVSLQADTVVGLAKWYRFRSYTHFLEVNLTIASCIRSPYDMEDVCRDFLVNQWEERICYSEVCFTPPADFHAYVDAVNRARSWAARELGVGMCLVIEIPPRARREESLRIARLAAERKGDGVVALGLSSPDDTEGLQNLTSAAETADAEGLATVVHVGRSEGPRRVLDAIRATGPVRIVAGAGPVGLEPLRDHARERNVPIALCPTADVKLDTVPSLVEHPLAELIDDRVPVTLGSGYPSSWGTTLTGEYLASQRAFEWAPRTVTDVVFQGVDGSLLPPHDREELRRRFRNRFAELSDEVAEAVAEGTRR